MSTQGLWYSEIEPEVDFCSAMLPNLFLLIEVIYLWLMRIK